jgi:hypothetical protein
MKETEALGEKPRPKIPVQGPEMLERGASGELRQPKTVVPANAKTAKILTRHIIVIQILRDALSEVRSPVANAPIFEGVAHISCLA